MTLRALVFNLPSLVWLLLSAATVVSWWLGTGHGGAADADSIRHATIAVMVLAFIKVRLVLTHFMEVREAPGLLRLITDAWVVVVCGLVITLYLQA